MATTNLWELLIKLPETIYDQLVSLDATNNIMALNQRFNIPLAKRSVISLLIIRLVTKEIATTDFISHLSLELDISDSAASILAKEIEDSVLHPIEKELQVTGVDMSMFHRISGPTRLPNLEPINKPADSVQSPPKAPAGIGHETRTDSTLLRPSTTLGASASAEAMADKSGAQANSLDVAQNKPSQIEQMVPTETLPSTPLPTDNSAPTILREEKAAVTPMVQTPRPTFSIKIPLQWKKYTAPAPVSATIETAVSEVGGSTSQAADRESLVVGSASRVAEPMPSKAASELSQTIEGPPRNDDGIDKKNAGSPKIPIPIPIPKPKPSVAVPMTTLDITPPVRATNNGKAQSLPTNKQDAKREADDRKISIPTPPPKIMEFSASPTTLPQVKRVVHYSRYHTLVDQSTGV